MAFLVFDRTKVKKDAKNAINVAKVKYARIISNFIKDMPVESGLRIDENEVLDDKGGEK